VPPVLPVPVLLELRRSDADESSSPWRADAAEWMLVGNSGRGCGLEDEDEGRTRRQLNDAHRRVAAAQKLGYKEKGAGSCRAA